MAQISQMRCRCSGILLRSRTAADSIRVELSALQFHSSFIVHRSSFIGIRPFSILNSAFSISDRVRSMTQLSTRPAIIESHNVDLIFSPDAGVFDLTYTVPEGSILGMIGPSGCGKTTTVRLALGLYTRKRGQLRVFDRDPTTFRASERERIGYIPQQFVLYPSLTVAENADFVASLYGLRSSQIKQRLNELLPFVDLAEARNRLGSQLSGGMQRRLMLAGALMHDPILLFADEPTA